MFGFQAIYIKESNIIAPYRNERVSGRKLFNGFSEMVGHGFNQKLAS